MLYIHLAGNSNLLSFDLPLLLVLQPLFAKYVIPKIFIISVQGLGVTNKFASVNEGAMKGKKKS